MAIDTHVLHRFSTEEYEAIISSGALADRHVELLDGLLVDMSPQAAPAAAAETAGPATATLGDVVVVADLSPRSTGPTTVSIQLQHTSGGPAEGVESLTARLSNGDVDLGEVPLVFLGPGSYAAEVVLPVPGTWRVQVSVRQSEFVNPVTTLELTVPEA